MQFDAEFVKNRSCEIAFAVFRCAKLIKQQNLKEELENAAIKLVTVFSAFNPKGFENEELGKADTLICLIKLAESIGEIRAINSAVLLREINNLISVAKTFIFEAERTREEDELKAMEGVFSDVKSNDENTSENEFGNGVEDFQKKEHIAELSDISLTKEDKRYLINFPIAESKKNVPEVILAKALPASRQGPSREISMKKEEVSFLKPSIRQEELIRQKRKDLVRQTSIQEKQGVFNEENPEESWQELILRRIREVRQITTHELAGFFPQISERTIRFYLQKLAEAGLVEKKGISGPGSYYIMKHGT